MRRVANVANRIGVLLVCALLAPLAGCHSAPTPPAGLAGLQIKVIAEPKAGTAAAPSRVSVYDKGSGSGGGSGAFERVDYADLHDIVVWLEITDQRQRGPAIAAPVSFELNNHGLPAGMTGVASVGQTIVFRNTGDHPVAAYSVSDNNTFNLGTIAPGHEASTTAKSAGLIEVVSDSIADPLARVRVAPTPWIALTHSGATVDFNGIPPGHYRIVSWHPRLPGSTADITLAPDQVGHASIDVGVNQLPKVESK